MSIKQLIKNISVRACVYFSIVTAIYTLLVMVVNVDDEMVLLDASRVLLFFVASILFAAAGGVLKLTKLHSALRIIIHYILTCFAFCACLMLPISPEPSTMFVGIALFSLIYFVSAGIIALIRSRYKANTESTAEYKSQFNKK